MSRYRSEICRLPSEMEMCLSGVELSALLKPNWFIWWRKDEILFVGTCKEGFSQFERRHQVLSTDEVSYFFEQNVETTQRRKKALLSGLDYTPLYNSSRNNSKVYRPEGHDEAINSLLKNWR